MKNSPVINSSSLDEQPAKNTSLSEENEEVIITDISSISAYNESEDNGPMTLQNAGGVIAHLPTELLECILLNLSYDDIAKVREVCQRFRDVGNGLLNRQFQNLKNCVESRLAEVVTEENALRRSRLQSGSSSTGTENSPSRETAKVAYEGTLICLRRLLHRLWMQIRLTRAVSYRLIFLSDVHPNCHFPSAFFAGNIIDEVHRILKISGTKETAREVMDEFKLNSLLNRWISFFLQKIERPLIQHMCSLNESVCPDLFGSKIIDILECLLNCKKDISFNIDSEGWCYMKGTYKLSRVYFAPITDLSPTLNALNASELMDFHEFLYEFAMANNDCHVMEAEPVEGAAIHNNKTRLYVHLLYRSPFLFRKSDYTFTFYRKASYREFAQSDIEGDDGENDTMNNVQSVNNSVTTTADDEEDFGFIIKVDMKCRMELAPIETYLDFLKKSSPEEDEDGVETSACTVQDSQDSSPDLSLKLEIECRQRHICTYLVQQNHRQQDGSGAHEVRTLQAFP